MDMTKPFDGQALVAALKAKSLPDAEKILTSDIMPVIFDWLNASVQLEAQSVPLLALAIPVLKVIEQKVLEGTIAYVDQKIA